MMVQVGIISAYLSSSDGEFGQTFAKLTLCQSGIGQIAGNVGTIGGGFGPTLNNVGTIGREFGLQFGKVGSIEAQIGTSGLYWEWMWSKGGFGHIIEWLKWTIPRQNQGVKRATRGLKPNELITPNDPEHPVETFT